MGNEPLYQDLQDLHMPIMGAAANATPIMDDNPKILEAILEEEKKEDDDCPIIHY